MLKPATKRNLSKIGGSEAADLNEENKQQQPSIPSSAAARATIFSLTAQISNALKRQKKEKEKKTRLSAAGVNVDSDSDYNDSDYSSDDSTSD